MSCVTNVADALNRAREVRPHAVLFDVLAGGETGRHLAAIVAPLLIHDLPVTTWWPGDVPLDSPMVEEVLADETEAVHLGLSGVPAILVRPAKGLITEAEVIEGAQPYDVIRATIDAVLDRR